MDVHAHSHTPRKKWTYYFWEFLMLFLAVASGFFAEYQLEHKIEKDRARQFLQSMLLDVRTNIKNLDSLISQDNIIIANHTILVNWLLQDRVTINRAEFAKKMGAVWVRNFLVRKETYEQMKSSGSLRYVGNIEFLKKIMDYERITNFAQYRNQEFEKLYYTELFIPALYKSYDLTCQLYLDTSNHSVTPRRVCPKNIIIGELLMEVHHLSPTAAPVPWATSGHRGRKKRLPVGRQGHTITGSFYVVPCREGQEA